MHIIYFAATMNYSLGSSDPEELAYYNKIRKEMDDIKKEPPKRGIPLNWDNLEKIYKWISILFYLIDESLKFIGLPLLTIFKGKE